MVYIAEEGTGIETTGTSVGTCIYLPTVHVPKFGTT